MLKVHFELGFSAIHVVSNKCLSTYRLNQTQDCWLLRGRKRLHKEILGYPCLSSHSSVSIATFTRQAHVVLCKWMRRHVLFITMSSTVQQILRMNIGEHNSLFGQVNCSGECESYSEITWCCSFLFSSLRIKTFSSEWLTEDWGNGERERTHIYKVPTMNWTLGSHILNISPGGNRDSEFTGFAWSGTACKLENWD